MQKQLIVEFNMNPTVASLLGWTINQHSIIAFALYVSGKLSRSEHKRGTLEEGKYVLFCIIDTKCNVENVGWGNCHAVCKSSEEQVLLGHA